MYFQTLPVEIIDKFCQYKAITILTGAGISIESGIPVYQDPICYEFFQGYAIEYLTSKDAWLQQPAALNQFFDQYRAVIQRARPGVAHQTLHGWELRRFAPSPPFRFNLLTLNFDGLHQLMGSESVVELQGSIWRMRCDSCRHRFDLVPFRLLTRPEYCSYCDGYLRPDLQLQNEEMPSQIYRRALAAAEECQIFMMIGLSAQTRFATLLAQAAKKKNAYLIEINPVPTPLSNLCQASILAPAQDVLPLFYWDYLPQDSFIVS